jgi:hypothetical protein
MALIRRDDITTCRVIGYNDGLQAELAMNAIEESIEATLDSNGQLCLTHQPRLPPGPVRVTIRVATAVGPRRDMAHVIQEIRKAGKSCSKIIET